MICLCKSIERRRENCSLRGFSFHNGAIKIEITGASKKTLTCSYLIGADGGNSKVRRLIDPSWSKENPEIACYQTYNHFSDTGMLPSGQWTVFFEPDISDTLCSVHHKDELLTLCVGGFKGHSLKTSMERFKIFLSDNLKVTLEKEYRSEGCLMRPGPPNLGKDRIILTDEAAGFIYLNGEGISAAIDSGYRAGKAVAKAIKEGVAAIDVYKANTVDILKHVGLCMENMRFFAAHE